MILYEAETPRLWLKRLSIEDHLDDFWEIWSNPDALIWSTQKAKISIEEAKGWITKVLVNETNPQVDAFAILMRPLPENPKPWTNPKGRPKMIGFVSTNRTAPSGLEVGYCVNLHYWGRGCCGEALAAFLELYWRLEERAWVKQLIANIDPENIPSQRVAQRAGARRRESLKDWYVKAIDGEGGNKRDLECWYLSRPGLEGENLEAWGKRMEEDRLKGEQDTSETERKEQQKN